MRHAFSSYRSLSPLENDLSGENITVNYPRMQRYKQILSKLSCLQDIELKIGAKTINFEQCDTRLENGELRESE